MMTNFMASRCVKWINSMELLDLSFLCSLFTWAKERSEASYQVARLDKAFSSSFSWRQLFPIPRSFIWNCFCQIIFLCISLSSQLVLPLAPNLFGFNRHGPRMRIICLSWGTIGVFQFPSIKTWLIIFYLLSLGFHYFWQYLTKEEVTCCSSQGVQQNTKGDQTWVWTGISFGSGWTFMVRSLKKIDHPRGSQYRLFSWCYYSQRF